MEARVNLPVGRYIYNLEVNGGEWTQHMSKQIIAARLEAVKPFTAPPKEQSGEQNVR